MDIQRMDIRRNRKRSLTSIYSRWRRGIQTYQEKKLEFRLGKLEANHKKAMGINTNDSDKGMVMDAQSEIVHEGLKLKHQSDDAVEKTHQMEGFVTHRTARDP